MNQLLNLLSFGMELVFGRDANMRRSRSQTIRSMIVIVVLALSIFGNYYMVKSLYGATAKYIALKEQLNDYNNLKERVCYLELHNQTLQSVITSLAPNLLTPAIPDVPPIPKAPTPPTLPTAPPPPPAREEHVVTEKEPKAAP